MRLTILAIHLPCLGGPHVRPLPPIMLLLCVYEVSWVEPWASSHRQARTMVSSSRMLWTAALFALADAAPSISFPLNAQVPPIARIAQPFSFVFSSSTFSSTSALTYSLSNPPVWLSIDSAARRLYGTPQEGDIPPGQVVGVPIDLTATDATGRTTLSATLVVSRDTSPTVEIPLSSPDRRVRVLLTAVFDSFVSRPGFLFRLRRQHLLETRPKLLRVTRGQCASARLGFVRPQQALVLGQDTPFKLAGRAS